MAGAGRSPAALIHRPEVRGGLLASAGQPVRVEKIRPGSHTFARAALPQVQPRRKGCHHSKIRAWRPGPTIGTRGRMRAWTWRGPLRFAHFRPT